MRFFLMLTIFSKRKTKLQLRTIERMHLRDAGVTVSGSQWTHSNVKISNSNKSHKHNRIYSKWRYAYSRKRVNPVRTVRVRCVERPSSSLPALHPGLAAQLRDMCSAPQPVSPTAPIRAACNPREGRPWASVISHHRLASGLQKSTLTWHDQEHWASFRPQRALTAGEMERKASGASMSAEGERTTAHLCGASSETLRMLKYFNTGRVIKLCKYT